MDTPSYYNSGITPIEFMRSHFTDEEMSGFYRGNAIKYLARAYKKHESPIDDLKKAKVYIDYLLQHELIVEDARDEKQVEEMLSDDETFASDDETFASDALAMSRDYYNEKVKHAKQDYYHIYPDWEAAMNRQKEDGYGKKHKHDFFTDQAEEHQRGK